MSDLPLIWIRTVTTGEFASSSEVIRDALRQLWQEAMHDKTPGVSADQVLDRLEHKYKAIADASGTAK